MTSITEQQSRSNQLYWVADNTIASGFPPVSSALRDPDGLLAIGGDLSPATLLDAYQKGIFPWYSSGQPILWWSPNPRCILELDDLKISNSLRKTIRKGIYQTSFNQAFTRVVRSCSGPRKGNDDTWITGEMYRAYTELHNQGHAISVETWHQDELVGGLYGVVIGRVFFGESMFSRKTDASKIALVQLVQELKYRQFRIIDCQVHSRHLQSLGAKPMQRDAFINLLEYYCASKPVYHWPKHRIQL